MQMQKFIKEKNMEEIFENKIKVYAKVNVKGYVEELCSDIFLKDVSDWEYVGEGVGDRFAHAQTMFLKEPLKAQDGTPKFTLDEIKKTL
jgi:hypothetical protein